MQAYVDMVKHLDEQIQQTRELLTNLETARQALAPLTTIEAEPRVPALAYTKKPMDVTDVVPLERSAQAASTEPVAVSPEPAEAPVKRVGRKATKKSTSAAKKTAAKAPVAPKRAPVDTALPRTSGEFWLKTMGKGKHTVAAIVDKAMQRLEVPEDKRLVLANRLSAWLYPSVKAGTLQATGSNKDGLKLYQAAR